MDRSLRVLGVAPARTCVWMDAGLLAYRLCDRGFACEHCPFDAAMRRDPSAHVHDEGENERATLAPWVFPADRLYTGGHLWVQVVRSGRVRIGLDACAARLLRSVQHVSFGEEPGELSPGARLCTVVIEAGPAPLGAPLTARAWSRNPRLDDEPGLAVREPYGAGWLAELALARPDELDGLLSAREARDLAELDARQFRRNIAFCMLSSAPGSADLALGGAFLGASMAVAGPGAYLALARGCVH